MIVSNVNLFVNFKLLLAITLLLSNIKFAPNQQDQ